MSQDQRKLILIQAYEATLAWQGDIVRKDDVTDYASLPLTGNTLDDHRLVLADWFVYRRDGTAWVNIAIGMPPMALTGHGTPQSNMVVPRRMDDVYIDLDGPTRYFSFGPTYNDWMS